MIERHALATLKRARDRQATVALIGPRQSGKTTLALAVAEGRPSLYLDLEKASDRARLSDPSAFLALHADELVILDEVHRMPALFEELRGVIDQGRRDGRRTGRFLVLGSAAIDLLRQSSESLAGRIEYVELSPLTAVEMADAHDVTRLWLRGGFPESFRAASDGDSLAIRLSFIRTYLERDVPMFGPRIAAEALERMWTMLAHSQGGLLNASRLASSMAISAPTVTNYIGLLVDLLLVRRLKPFHANLGKRLVKSPKVYVRDSGLTHALLGIQTMDDLLGHPIAGPSWEGFVIESLLAVAPAGTSASFYQSSGGAEIDLILEMGARHGVWAIEIKRTSAPKLERGLRSALADITPTKAFIVHGGHDQFPLGGGVEAISLQGLTRMLAALQ
ncbi:ATP-binding protein [Gemmatimonas sp.]|uniref:ATP-binding protein n=1 Tax=Gemmatimonas sp. TaxID=1962908 RepID=UPI0035622250